MAYRRTALVEARLDASRRRLVDAAIATVAQGGYAALTVDAVAAGAGLATGSLYRHYPSKSALVAEVFCVAAEAELAAVRAAAEPASDPAVARLARAVETFARRALRGGRLAYALLAEPVDPAVEEERLVFRRAYRDLFAGVLDDGVRRGELPPQDTTVAAAGLVGAIGEALVGPLSPAGPGRRAAPVGLVEALVAFCVRSVGGRSPA